MFEGGSFSSSSGDRRAFTAPTFSDGSTFKKNVCFWRLTRMYDCAREAKEHDHEVSAARVQGEQRGNEYHVGEDRWEREWVRERREVRTTLRNEETRDQQQRASSLYHPLPPLQSLSGR